MLYLKSLLSTIIILLFRPTPTHQQQQQDPSTLNGGSIMAMAGKNCVAIAVDKRFGSGPQMVNIAPRTVFIPHSKLLVAFAGLDGDIQTITEELSIHVDDKVNRNSGFGFPPIVTERRIQNVPNRDKNISPNSLSSLLSHLLYGRRQSPYYVEPIIAGLVKQIIHDDREPKHGHDSDCSEDNSNSQHPLLQEGNNSIQYLPYLCAQDLIGAQSYSKSFVCSGVASKALYGVAEAMWRPNLDPEELVQICGRAFLSALERDCLSGYGAIIYLLVGGEGIYEYDLACRND